jgi:uncharacterized membrane protein
MVDALLMAIAHTINQLVEKLPPFVSREFLKHLSVIVAAIVYL